MTKKETISHLSPLHFRSTDLEKRQFFFLQKKEDLFFSRTLTSQFRSLGLAFLLDLQFLAQDRGDFALHERPGYVGTDERTLLAARTVDFRTGTLTLDALPRARKTELVLRHRRTLDKMSVLEALLAQRALERSSGQSTFRAVDTGLRRRRFGQHRCRHAAVHDAADDRRHRRR